MNSQELVEKVLAFYQTPGNKPAFIEEEAICVYFMSETQKCGIACLLEKPYLLVSLDVNQDTSVDELFRVLKYQQASSDFTMSSRASEALEDVEKILPSDMQREKGIEFLMKIQECHDIAVSLCFDHDLDFSEDLKMVFQEHGLMP